MGVDSKRLEYWLRTIYALFLFVWGGGLRMVLVGFYSGRPEKPLHGNLDVGPQFTLEARLPLW